MMASFSVVIPTYNEQNYLGDLLSDLSNQTYPPHEVIVVDCHSEDKTLAVTQSFRHKLPLKLIDTRLRTPAAARNAGAKIAKGTYLLFIDADMRIPDYLIQKLVEASNENSVDILITNFRSDGGHSADRFIIWGIRLMMSLYNNWLHKVMGIGGVICVKRQLHERAGGFNENKGWHDDIEYYEKLREFKPNYIFLKDLETIPSSRRFKDKSFIRGFGIIFFENNALARHFFQPVLKNLGKNKKYGHYDQ